MKSVCVFCGSADNLAAKYLIEAAALGRALAARKIRLVYGGGSTGVMGALAGAVLDCGGEAFGVIPEFFNTERLAHASLTRMEVVPDMHRRKARFAELSDGCVMLPGGLGTLEEFFEALTWAQIGLHQKPIGILNGTGYFDPLLAMLRRIGEEGFLYDEHHGLYICAAAGDELLDRMAAYAPPPELARWVERA